jgi:hypothetical protein
VTLASPCKGHRLCTELPLTGVDWFLLIVFFADDADLPCRQKEAGRFII